MENSKDFSSGFQAAHLIPQPPAKPCPKSSQYRPSCKAVRRSQHAGQCQAEDGKKVDFPILSDTDAITSALDARTKAIIKFLEANCIQGGIRSSGSTFAGLTKRKELPCSKAALMNWAQIQPSEASDTHTSSLASSASMCTNSVSANRFKQQAAKKDHLKRLFAELPGNLAQSCGERWTDNTGLLKTCGKERDNPMASASAGLKTGQVEQLKQLAKQKLSEAVSAGTLSNLIDGLQASQAETLKTDSITMIKTPLPKERTNRTPPEECIDLPQEASCQMCNDEKGNEQLREAVQLIAATVLAEEELADLQDWSESEQDEARQRADW